jgi:hypothetical protein
MKKNNLPKPISILILTLLNAIVWIALNIYRAITMAPSSEVPQTISQPLNPTLNKDSVGKIESAIFFDSSQIPEVTIGASATPEPVTALAPVNTPLPTATASATPVATPVATP